MMVLRVSIGLVYLSIIPFFAAQGGKYDVNLDIYNVGQGQCSVLRCKNKETGEEEAMLVDIGSTSYGKEFTYQEKQPPTPQKKEKTEKKKGVEEEKGEKKTRPRQSLVTAPDFKESTEERDEKWVKTKVKDFTARMRLQFLKKKVSQPDIAAPSS